MRFKKKPVVIEAIQFTGAVSFAKMKEAWPGFDTFANFSAEMAEKMPISTLEGLLNACTGDWIIKGVKGEFYPCRNDIFEMTYDAEPESKQDRPGYCNICDQAMPRGEEMFRFHGYSGPCPKTGP